MKLVYYWSILGIQEILSLLKFEKVLCSWTDKCAGKMFWDNITLPKRIKGETILDKTRDQVHTTPRWLSYLLHRKIGKKSFSFPNFWIYEAGYAALVKHAWETKVVVNPMYIFMKKLNHVKNSLIEQ